MESIAGTVESVSQHNPDNGYFVARIIDFARNHVRVTGYAPRVIPGETLTAEGAWIQNAGQRLFESTKATVSAPRSVDGVRRYLASGSIRGIGPAYAEKLVAAFGDDVFTIVDRSPDRLREIVGIGEERASAIIEAWHEQRAIRGIMVFLHANGVTTAKASKIYRKYGNDAIGVVQKNPYQLANDIDGLGFISADQIAKNVGYDLCSPDRLRAGVHHALNEAAADGHTALKKSTLVGLTCKLLEVPPAAVDDAIHAEIFGEALVAAEKAGETYVALPALHYAEKGVASRLLRLFAEPIPWSSSEEMDHRARFGEEHEAPLNQAQMETARWVLQNKVSIISAGVGTEKLRVLQSIVRLLQERGIKLLLVVPVADVASRIARATGVIAQTIPVLAERQQGEDGTDSVEAVVLYEASAVDTAQANAMLKAVPSSAALIMIGDVNLFASVGAGQVFRDLIASGRFPTVTLSEEGQCRPSAIDRNARKIAHGEYPDTPGIASKGEFRFVYAPDPKVAARRIVDLVTRELPGYLDLDPLRDIQVLCPMSRGECGTKALNFALTQKINRNEQRRIEANGVIFRVGDRVTVRAKRRGREASGGDIGYVVSADTEARRLLVDFYGRTEMYELEQLNNLAHAYATPLQRAAGRQFRVVIIPVVTQHFMMLRRSLLYTGVTSGEDLVILVGQPKALAIAVKNADDNNRSTLLPEILRTASGTISPHP